MAADWGVVAALALAVGAAAFTLTKTMITASYRLWLARKNVEGQGPQGAHDHTWWKWPYLLFSCPYCLGHWLSAVAVLIYRPRLTQGWVVTDLGVSWLAVTALAAGVSGLIDRAIHPK